MAELDRLRNVLPVFLWLWEHRAEVKPLLRDGASWRALSAGLARLGFADRAGSVPREEYCRAAWSRVLAYEPIITGAVDEALPAPHAETPVPPCPADRRVPPPRDAESNGRSLNEVLAKARRPTLSEPPPLNVASRGRRAAEGGDTP
jgi:hypothetical protein